MAVASVSMSPEGKADGRMEELMGGKGVRQSLAGFTPGAKEGLSIGAGLAVRKEHHGNGCADRVRHLCSLEKEIMARDFGSHFFSQE